jgi:hypothetical protein
MYIFDSKDLKNSGNLNNLLIVRSKVFLAAIFSWVYLETTQKRHVDYRTFKT